MKQVKKVEIIIESMVRNEVTAMVDEMGIDGWTVLPASIGMGTRGRRDADGLSSGLENVLVLVVCEEGQAKVLIEKIRPILARSGGLCLLSDAQYLKH